MSGALLTQRGVAVQRVALLTTRGIRIFTIPTTGDDMSLNGMYLTVDSTVVGPVYPLTVPVGSDFAWVNQGGATVADFGGGAQILTVPGSATTSLRCRVKTAPATPYTITALLAVSFTDVASSPIAGLCFRESGTGEIVNAGLCWISSKLSWHIGKYTNATTWSGANYYYTGNPIAFSPCIGVVLRIADDGANRICSYSADGYNFKVLHTVGRTDFLTADQVGFFGDAGASASQSPLVSLLSWTQA